MTATNSAQPARNPFARLYDALIDPKRCERTMAPLFAAPNYRDQRTASSLLFPTVTTDLLAKKRRVAFLACKIFPLPMRRRISSWAKRRANLMFSDILRIS